MSGRKLALIILMAAAAMAAFSLSVVRADEDEEKPITSSVAQIARNAAGQVFIKIRPAAQKEIGITTEILKPVVRPIEIEAYGYIVDPAPLSALNASLVSTQAAIGASSAQYRRTRRLYGEHKNASLRELQSAQAAYLTDQSRLEASLQQLRDQWGSAIARMDAAARSRLVNALVERRQAIARVTAPVGTAPEADPRTATVIMLGHPEQPLEARAVYNSPIVVPNMQGQTFLLLIAAGQFPLRPGTAVSASLPNSGTTAYGVMIPRSAVVRYAGREWVYREVDGDRFMRRQIEPAQRTATGYFVTQGLAPETRIVVAGTQALLSEELQAQIQMGD
jgi:membrane fusion protein, multidrug efflux system